MAKLCMIIGLGTAEDLARGKQGAFYHTLEEFHKHWDRIDIVIPKIKNATIGRETILFGNVMIHQSALPLLLHPLFFIQKMRAIYREHKFDVMTVQEFPPFYNGIGARILWHLIHVPYMLEIHHVTGYPRAATIKEVIYRWMTRIFIGFDAKHATAVRVVNQHQTPKFLIAAGVPEVKICYASSLYIDQAVFTPHSGIKQYDLIFVGRLVENKGIKLFLDAVKQSNCSAVIVGDGPYRHHVKHYIEQYHLESRVTCIGWAKDDKEVAILLNQSKLLIMSSYNEGGPRVVVEAMACGVPVLATPVGIVPDIIRSGVSGEIIDWNGQDIAQKAELLLQDHVLYNQYRAAGIAIAAKFERVRTVQNYADTVKQLIR